MMGIGTNAQKPDEGQMNRELEEIACGVWFTSSGTAIPKLVKYRDRDGMIHSIGPIRILSGEKK